MAREPLALPSEVAAHLRISEQALADMRYKGDGPPFIKQGRSVRYDWAEVDRWQIDHTVQPAA